MHPLRPTRSQFTGDPVTAWRQATLAGNAHFELGEDGPARACYERARDLAMSRSTRWPCADDGMAALVVSTLNLAEVLLRGDEGDEACRLTAGLHRSLVDAAANADMKPALRDAARSHLRQTFAALVRLQERLGPRPGITRLLFDTCTSDSPMTAH